jgi:hypothetical protein
MSGHSKGDEPNAKNTGFKPSKEVEEKMRPVSRESFFNLLRRAANPPPVLKPSPKAK